MIFNVFVTRGLNILSIKLGTCHCVLITIICLSLQIVLSHNGQVLDRHDDSVFDSRRDRSSNIVKNTNLLSKDPGIRHLLASEFQRKLQVPLCKKNEALTISLGCRVVGKKISCQDYLLPRNPPSSCDIDIIQVYRWCNKSLTQTLSWKKLKPKFNAATLDEIYKNNILPPQTCASLKVRKKIDICNTNRKWNASLGIPADFLNLDGTPENSPCYAFRFKNFEFKTGSNPPTAAPNISPTQNPTKECDVSTNVECTLENGVDCNNVILPVESCGAMKADYSFTYCNNDSTEVSLFKKTRVVIKKLTYSDLDKSVLKSGECRIYTQSQDVDTCEGFAAQIILIGSTTNNNGSEDECFSYTFSRAEVTQSQTPTLSPPTNLPRKTSTPTIKVTSTPTFPPTFPPSFSPTNRPTPTLGSCPVSVVIDCNIPNGPQCDDVVITSTNCNQTFRYKFTYCNLGSSTLQFWTVRGLLNNKQLFRSRKVAIPMGGCITQISEQEVNICRGSFFSSIYLLGKDCEYFKGLTVSSKTLEPTITPSNDPTRKPSFLPSLKPVLRTSVPTNHPSPVPSIPPSCSVSANVQCTVVQDGSDCSDLLLQRLKDACGSTSIVFKYTWCNLDSSQVVTLNTVRARINYKNTFFLKGMNVSECMEKQVETEYRPCDYDSISASLLIAGTNNFGENCKDFSLIELSPLSKSPTKIPTSRPTFIPTSNPTSRPTFIPTSNPTSHPTFIPSSTICPGMSDKERSDKIKDIAKSVSNQEELVGIRLEAYKWLSTEDGYKICPDDKRIIQRYVLAVFYLSTGGDNIWESCGRSSTKKCDPKLSFFPNDPIIPLWSDQIWLSSADECLWGGVACNEKTKLMDRIEFDTNSLKGTLPSELGSLTNLRWLLIEGASNEVEYGQGINGLSGPIPPQFEKLTNLLVLDLNFNYLTGSIPSEIFSLRTLRHIDLNDNNLSGALHPTIGNLSRLKDLQLDQNQLSSKIPSEIGLLTKLSRLILDNNNFTGVLPSSVCSLQKLQLIHVDCTVQCSCCDSCF
mmetsp:Transcript_5747/g.8329  ORF Transcript_5747/g.8329 Transcript_5747/m.8329 type:complete len:1030 (+) Transcript_5747:129-3218(+)